MDTMKGIKTIADLDAWCWANQGTDAQGRKFVPSRYAALKILVGEDRATAILNDMAIDQCCRRKNAR